MTAIIRRLALALLLAGVGLYGVLNYSLLQREREFGIRLALGARMSDVARNVTGGIFSAVCVGGVAGLGLGITSARYIESLLYQVKTTDVGVLAFPSLIILATALLAAVPAVIRALRIDPVDAGCRHRFQRPGRWGRRWAPCGRRARGQQ